VVWLINEVSERDDVIGYDFRVLDEVGGLLARPGIPIFPAASFTSAGVSILCE
jgi:hypothetical protein